MDLAATVGEPHLPGRHGPAALRGQTRLIEHTASRPADALRATRLERHPVTAAARRPVRLPPAVRRTVTREIRRTTDRPANHRRGRPKLAHPQVLTISPLCGSNGLNATPGGKTAGLPWDLIVFLWAIHCAPRVQIGPDPSATGLE